MPEKKYSLLGYALSALMLCIQVSNGTSNMDNNDLLTLDTKVIYAAEGKSVNILARAGESRIIQFCRWDSVNNSKVGSNGLIFVNDVDELPLFPMMATGNDNKSSRQVTGYDEFGEGLSNGECGITIHNVTESDVTTWKYLLIEFNKNEGNPVAVTREVKLEKALQPLPPVISNKEELTGALKTNVDTISCCAENGAPPPRLQFFIDEMVLESTENIQEPSYPKYCIYAQINITRHYNGKTLGCSSEHLTFAGQQEDKVDLNLAFSPLLLSSVSNAETRTIVVNLTEEDSVKIRFLANPKPSIKWLLEKSSDESLTKGVPRELAVQSSEAGEPFTWEAIFLMDQKASNANMKFRVVATNAAGSTEVFLLTTSSLATSTPVSGIHHLYWLLFPLIAILLCLVIAIVFTILARACGWLCWHNHAASYDTKENGKDLVYNPVMTTEIYP